MLSKIFSAGNLGLEAVLVEVEVDLARAFPRFNIVGLADKAVQESKERVESAIKNSQLKFPSRFRLTVNLAPANIKKEGPIYDLPIAVGILIASGQIKENMLPPKSLFLGELSLKGEVRYIKGLLPMLLTAKKKGIKNVFLPKENVNEANLVSGLTFWPLEKLSQIVSHFTGKGKIECFKAQGFSQNIPKENYEIDFSLIRGQDYAKRALQIAAAGGHNVLMIGPPGSGKTLLARALPSILPPMTEKEVYKYCYDNEVDIILFYPKDFSIETKKIVTTGETFPQLYSSVSGMTLEQWSNIRDSIEKKGTEKGFSLYAGENTSFLAKAYLGGFSYFDIGFSRQIRTDKRVYYLRAISPISPIQLYFRGIDITFLTED